MAGGYVYFEAHPDMEAARRRDHQLKGQNRAKKNALVKAINPERRDLSGELAKMQTEL